MQDFKRNFLFGLQNQWRIKRGHYGQVPGAPRFWGPRASQSHGNFLRVAMLVTNVEAAFRIYLTMMVSLRSLDFSKLASSFVSAKIRKVSFL
jgi:hypothetical protein